MYVCIILLPFISNAYENAYFSRSVPYLLMDLEPYPAKLLASEQTTSIEVLLAQC